MNRTRYCDIRATSLDEILKTCERHIRNISLTELDSYIEGDITAADKFYCDMFRETWKDLHSDVQAIIASATRGAVPQGVFGANFPLGFTYDAVGNELTYKNNDGYSSEYTYDANGNQLTFENSNGYSCEFIYDDNDGLVIKNTSSNL